MVCGQNAVSRPSAASKEPKNAQWRHHLQNTQLPTRLAINPPTHWSIHLLNYAVADPTKSQPSRPHLTLLRPPPGRFAPLIKDKMEGVGSIQLTNRGATEVLMETETERRREIPWSEPKMQLLRVWQAWWRRSTSSHGCSFLHLCFLREPRRWKAP